jgi:hypothetical protein
MDARTNTNPTLCSVEADFYYLAPMAEPPHTYAYDPPPGVPRTNAISEPHRVAARDVRPIAADMSLDREGFALLRQQSAVRDFYDEDELRRVYYPEAERLVAEATCAARVIVFDHTVRRRIWGAQDRRGSRWVGYITTTPRHRRRSAFVT